jgi:hypothetical protein
LEHCSVCGSAPDEDGRLCPRCADLLQRGDRDSLKARNYEYLAGRFGPFVNKDPELYVAAIERRFP